MESNNNFPLEIVDVNPKLANTLMKQFTGEATGYVRVGPKGYFLPKSFRHEASHIYNMSLRPDDVFVASFPRSGTTWTQELVWMVATDLDYDTAKNIPLMKRYKFLECSSLFHPAMKESLKSAYCDSKEQFAFLEYLFQSATIHLNESTSQRFIKTHLPLSLLPPQLLDSSKVVYVARDPRDVVVSYYHFNCQDKRSGYIGDFKTYWNYFLNDLRLWSPYFEHLKEAWEMRHHPNMLFLFYEGMSEDLPATVRRVGKFFNKHFTDDQVTKLCDHLSFENFKNNKSVNLDVLKKLDIVNSNEQSFIRKGKVGDWRDYFDDEMTREADKWMAANLKNTDFRFPHLEK